jgi:Fic family protein
MTRRTDIRRDSKPASPALYTNQENKEYLEAKNGLLQFDEVIRLVDESISTGRFELTPAIIQNLHNIAISNIYICAGKFRTKPVEIRGTDHLPPDTSQIPDLIQQMCRYVNENWEVASPIHLAAYIMWRLNWIHPFSGGNGRTSRAVSYLVLCAKLGYRIPGKRAIPDFIVDNREPYYKALDAADIACKQGNLDVSEMEKLLENLLLSQLKNVYQSATGKQT